MKEQWQKYLLICIIINLTFHKYYPEFKTPGASFSKAD